MKSRTMSKENRYRHLTYNLVTQIQKHDQAMHANQGTSMKEIQTLKQEQDHSSYHIRSSRWRETPLKRKENPFKV